MKLLIISPGWPEGSFWKSMSFQFPYLSMAALAGLSPDDVEIEIIDENVETLEWDTSVDAAALTAMTALAPRAYSIADAFREKNIPVVMGGFHPSVCPQEALQHSDAVVVGEAELVWSDLLNDIRANNLKRIYKAEKLADISKSPPPDWSVFDRKPYFFTNLIQLSRGCPYSCEFCSVRQFFGNTYRFKSIEAVVREIERCCGGRGFVFFVDDNIIGNRLYAVELFKTLKKMKLKWLSHATLSLAQDPELLNLCAESGCIGLFIGFESLSQKNLQKMGKANLKASDYLTGVKKIHDKGIGIEGAFILGCDEDDSSVFDNTLEFIYKAKIDGVHFSVLTPLPGTPLFHRLERENRIIDRNWEHYDLAHVVIDPKLMSPRQLHDGFNLCYREAYSFSSILKRLMPPRKSLQIFGPLNFGIRKASKKSLKFDYVPPI